MSRYRGALSLATMLMALAWPTPGLSQETQGTTPAVKAAPFAALVEAGRTFAYTARLKKGKGKKDKITSTDVQFRVQSVKQFSGGQLVEVEISGKAKSFRNRSCPWRAGSKWWLEVTEQGVYDVGTGKQPTEAAAAKVLKGKPAWPVRPGSGKKKCDEDGINTAGDGGPDRVHTPGEAGAEVINGRSAVCRCISFEGGSSSSSREECLDPDLGFVRLTFEEDFSEDAPTPGVEGCSLVPRTPKK